MFVGSAMVTIQVPLVWRLPKITHRVSVARGLNLGPGRYALLGGSPGSSDPSNLDGLDELGE